MPLASDRSPSALANPSPGRRIFSRITTPFATAPRAIADYSITIDDEHKQYSPGDVVKGHVNVRTTRSTRLTHIVVALHGFVQVYKNPGTPSEGHRQGGSRSQKSADHVGNGFARLFDDEQVLCGDGKLTEGTFRFQFNLEFPERDLPSSIDFERGTITYMVTATLTRPTTMSPVMVTERKIYFVERIDISRISGPKPRTITLEPIPKRTKGRNQGRRGGDQSDRTSRQVDSSRQSSDPTPDSRTSSNPSSQNDSNVPVPLPVPPSPAPSDLSLDSALSNAHASQSGSPYPRSLAGSSNGTMSNSKLSLSSKIITATVEPEAGGCLRGDYVTVKVGVTHTKHIKSLYGVIATFYRQARVDLHPSAPIGPTEKGKTGRFEDYYPKSVTGLGGLSLSGAGSNHVFRKDLSQVMVPLIVDPVTLTSEITAKVRVPDDAFPTISNVPGGMISFRYYVEVVLDIQGKLSGQDRGIASLPGLPDHVMLAEASNMERTAATPFGSTIIDTTPVRRDKSVVTCTFEIIVGTRDSDRKKGKRKADPSRVTVNGSEPTSTPAESPPHSNESEPSQAQSQAHAQGDGTNGQAYSEDDAYWYGPEYYDPRWYNYGYWNGQYNGYSANGEHDQYYYPHDPSYTGHDYFPGHPPPVPFPQMPDESQMTEKERVRHAEARLLPSQPPVDGEASEDHTGVSGATAPFLPEESDLSQGRAWATTPSYQAGPSSSSAGVPSSSALLSSFSPMRSPSVPQYTPPATGPSTPIAIVSPSDDKQELQRRQLQQEASAPPGDEATNDDEPASASGTSTTGAPDLPTSSIHDYEASAPTLDEADAEIHDSHADATPSAPGLPRYER